MKSWFKRGLGALGVLALVLAGAVLFRTWTVTVEQVPPARPSAVAVDGKAAVARLSRAIRFRTVSHTDRGRNDPAAFFAFNDWLIEAFPAIHGALERETVNGLSLLYRWRGTDPTLAPVLFAAHADVVPVETPGSWQHPPFDGLVADDAVWGRGAMDDKGPLMALMEAVEALAAAGHRPARTIYLAFGHDEEIGGGEGAARIAALLESRGIRPAMVLDEGSAILEGLLPGDFPVAAIAVAGKGYLSLELAAESAGGHSSIPPELTAAGRVARAVHRVQSAPFPERLTPPVRGLLENLAPHLDFGSRALFSNLWLFEPLLLATFTGSPGTNAMVRTTTAPTMLAGSPKDNILPERASAVVNFRILPGETAEDVRARVARLVADERVAVSQHGEMFADPSPVSPVDSPAYRAIAATARGMDERIVAVPMLVVGATDARYYTGIADNVYRFLPLRLSQSGIDTIHGRDEHIRVPDYLNMIRGYATLLEHPWVSGQMAAPEDVR